MFKERLLVWSRNFGLPVALVSSVVVVHELETDRLHDAKLVASEELGRTTLVDCIFGSGT